jgi:hypothetical protein
MRVDIYETWNDQFVWNFNDGKALPGKRGRNGNNAALVNGHIQRLKSAIAENGAAGQQQTHTLSSF